MKSVVIIIICLAFLAGCNVMDSSGTEDFKLLAEEPASIIIEVLKVEATLMENGKEVIVADCWEDIDILNDAEINKMVHYVAMNIDATLTNIFFHTGEITLTAIEIPYTCKIPSGKLHINLPVMSVKTLRQVRFSYDVEYRHPTDEKYIVEPVIKIIEVIPNSPPYICDRSPLDGAVDVLCEDNMSWAFSDPDGDILIYDVYFGTNPTPMLSASEIVDTYYAPSEINGHTTYYWKVVARDGWGGETEEPVWSFTTANRPPEISIPDQCIYENETLTLNLLVYASDQDDDPLSFILLSGVGNMTDATYTYSPDYDASGTHEVEIEVSDGWGGNATNTFIITVINVNRAPLIPSYPSPENGEVDVSLDITLSWKCGDPDGDSLTYDVYFGSSSTPALVASDIVSPEYNPGILDANTTHYWKIVAKDGKEEAEGPLWSFKTILPNRPPEIPLLILPENESTVSGPEVEFLWECIDPDGDPLLYDFYLAPEAEPFELPYLMDYPENHLLISVEELPPEFETWRWKVVAKDGKGGMSESLTLVFSLNHPPLIPSEPYPPDGAIDLPCEVVMSWECSDPDGDPLVYDIYFGPLGETLLKVMSDYPSKNYSPGVLEYNKMYFWKIVAKDDYGGITEGPLWNFEIVPLNNPPENPLLIIPQDGSVINEPEIEFLWECIDPDGDPLLYDFYLAPEAEPFELPYLMDYPENHLLISVEELPPEFETWRWKVVAKDGKGGMSESETWMFTVLHEPPLIDIWGGYGSEPGQFDEPVGICIDTEGYFYVADSWFEPDYGNHRVQKFFLDGTFFTMWGEGWQPDYVLKAPFDIEVDAQDSAYVIDTVECKVKIFKSLPGDTEVRFVQEFGKPGEELGEFMRPMGVAIGDEPENLRTVYVADTENHRIQKFTLDWLYEPPIFKIISVIEWGGFGSGPGQFISPHGIAVYRDLVFVADEGNCRIQVFNNFGEYLYEWGEPGEGPGQFVSVWGIAVSPDWSLNPLVYVTDPLSGRVLVFTIEGEFITQFGRWGTAPGEFRDPFGVAVDYEGFIYVADTGNQRIQKFAPIW